MISHLVDEAPQAVSGHCLAAKTQAFTSVVVVAVMLPLVYTCSLVNSIDGSWHGHWSFKTFSQERTQLDVPASYVDVSWYIADYWY